ncbi:14644_t:CDS:1, partial [Dentiscutata erythropus]
TRFCHSGRIKNRGVYHIEIRNQKLLYSNSTLDTLLLGKDVEERIS